MATIYHLNYQRPDESTGSVIGNGGDTILDAVPRAFKDARYYTNAGYILTACRVREVCPTCEDTGFVKRCRHKSHAFWAAACHKVCPACKGQFPTQDMLPALDALLRQWHEGE